MDTNNESTSTQESGKAPANVSVEQLKAMLKTRNQAPAAGVAAASPTTGTTTAAGATTEEATTTTTAAADAAAGENADSSSGGSTETSTEPEVEAAEDAADTDGEGAEEEGGDEKEIPKAIRDLQKRVAKLTARAKQAEEALAARDRAQAETPVAEEVKSPSGSPGTSSPTNLDPRFAQDATLTKVATELRSAEATVGWAEDALDHLQTSGEETVEVGGEKFNRAQVRQILRNAQGQRTELAARKAAVAQHLEGQWNEELRAHSTEAVKAYPWLADASTPEFKEALEITKAMPALMHLPTRALVLGHYIEGRKAWTARQSKAAANGGKAASLTQPVKATPKPAAIPTTGGTVAPKVDLAAVKVKGAAEQLKKSGRTKDLAALLKARNGKSELVGG